MDSPTGSSKGSKGQPLHRGEACLTCRKRKMRCDAGKPACTPCLRSGKGSECEYEETRYQAMVDKLEEEIRTLRTKVVELEARGTLPSPQLTSPLSPPPFSATSYIDTSSHQASFGYLPGTQLSISRGNSPRGTSESSGSQTSPFGPNVAILPYASSPPATGTPVTASPGGLLPYEMSSGHYDQIPTVLSPQDVTWGSTATRSSHHDSPGELGMRADLPHQSILRLVDIFLPHANQCGLDIHPNEFLQSLSSPQHRPHPALMNAIYLWACHFSQSPSYMQLEPRFMQRTILELARGMESRDRLVNLVQAQSLLALYLFVTGRLLEGYHHAGGAMRLAVTLGLHQIQSGSWRPPGTDGNNAFLAPPTTAREEDERIRAWWQVFNLDRCWSTVLELPPALDDFDHPRASITTPFPRNGAASPPMPVLSSQPVASTSSSVVGTSFALWGECLRGKNVPLKSESPFPFLLQGSMYMPSAPTLPPLSSQSAAPIVDAASNSLTNLTLAPEYSFVERLDTLESLRAKGSSLFMRASALLSSYHPQRQTNPSFWVDFHTVSNAIDRFISVLPHLPSPAHDRAFETHDQGSSSSPADRQLRFALHALAHTAALRLNSIFAQYDPPTWRDRCLASARQVAAAASQLTDSDFALLDPFVGICWVHVGAFLYNELYASNRAPSSPRTSSDLQTITHAAKRLSTFFPFLDIHVQQLERTPA